MKSLLVSIAGASFALVVGCAPAPLCEIGPTFAPHGASVDSLELLAFERLLLARTSGETERGRMCTGAPSQYPASPEGCVDREDPGAVLPEAPIAFEDLVLESADGGFWLAFLPIRRYASGMAEGPVAIIVREGDAVEVRALGMLRTLPERIGLRLERVGEHVILFVDGERCEGGTCARATRMLLLRDRAFVPLHIATAGQSCLGPAVFARQESRTISASARVDRVYLRNQGLDIEGATIRIAEEISVEERDRTDSGVAPRIVRRSDATITLVVDAEEARLVADGTSRWSSMLLDASSLGGTD